MLQLVQDFKLLKHNCKRFHMLKHTSKRLPMLKHNCKRLLMLKHTSKRLTIKQIYKENCFSFNVTPRFPQIVNNTNNQSIQRKTECHTSFKVINRVKLLFIKTTLSKFIYIVAENYFKINNFVQQSLALWPQRKQLN